MGIVKMERLTLVGLAREKDAVVHALSKLGAVDVRTDVEPSAEWLATHQQDTERLQQAVEQRQLLEQMIPVSKDLLPYKKPLFTLKRSITMRDFMKYDNEAERQEIIGWAKCLRDQRRAYQEAEARKAAIQLQLDVLQPWQEALEGREKMGERRLNQWLGRMNSRAQFEALQLYLEEEYPLSALAVLTETDPKAPMYCLLIAPASQQDVAYQQAQQRGFRPLQQKELKLTPQQEFKKLQAQLQEVEAELIQRQKESKDLAHHVSAFEELSDYLSVQIEKLEHGNRLLSSERLFALSGYIPSHLVKGTKKGLEETYIVYVATEAVDKQEDYPILLQNNAFVKPYEAITDMFSLPMAGEIDPTPSVAPFYCIFFGMMFSDVGYGLLFCLATAFLVWKVKVQGNFRKMCQAFFQCGLSSIIWGFLFGGFFGNLINEFTAGSIKFPVGWFNPMDDPTKLMIWSVIFGTIHIFIGMGVKIHILFATGRVKEALFDIVPWYFIITGLGLLGAGMTTIGKYLAGFGALVILLFAGRPSKNPLVRLFKGLGSLYGITGYFSDIMSYTRILALCLSTSVIAMVVNLLALLPGKGIIGLLFFVLIALLGHTLNFALSALSAYVHTTRLHYVEFFSKFFEGGGRAFRPLAFHTKYVLVDKPEEPTPQTENLRTRFKRFVAVQE